MQVRDYARTAEAEHLGYVQCLQTIRHDHADGLDIDFTGWEEAETLTGIGDDDLSLLVEMYSDFCGSRKERVFRIIKQVGIVPGVRQSGKKPENFEEEAEKYMDGKESCSEAAKNCGLPYMTFRNRVDAIVRHTARTQNDEIYASIHTVCQQWKRHEINKTEAAERLGIRVPSFNRILALLKIERDPEPAGFSAAYESWKSGKISKDEAIQRCRIGRTHFEELVRKRERSTGTEKS